MGVKPCAFRVRKAKDGKSVPIHSLELNSMLVPKDLTKFASPFELNDSQCAAMRAVWGGSEAEWSMKPDAGRHEHPVCAMVRTLAYHAALRFLDGYRVLDVGGNVARAIGATATNVHCCQPTFDAPDAARRVGGRISLVQRNYHVEEACRFDPSGVTACKNRVERCAAQAEALLLVDTVYYLGEPYILHQMQNHELAVVLYHQYQHSCTDYMGEATVSLADYQGQQYVAMTLPGNPAPYCHPAINISSDCVSKTMVRDGKPLSRYVVARWGWYHMVVYCWGPLPVHCKAKPWGCLGSGQTPDRRGIGAPLGVPIRSDLCGLPKHRVEIRLLGVDRYGVSIDTIKSHLVASYASRLQGLTGFDQLIMLLRNSYYDQMRKVNTTDEVAARFESPTVYEAAFELISVELANRGGVTTATLWDWLLFHTRAWRCSGRAAPRLPFGVVYTPSCNDLFLGVGPPESHVLDLDELVRVLSLGRARVFRSAAAVASPGTILQGTAAAAP